MIGINERCICYVYEGNLYMIKHQQEDVINMPQPLPIDISNKQIIHLAFFSTTVNIHNHINTF